MTRTAVLLALCAVVVGCGHDRARVAVPAVNDPYGDAIVFDASGARDTRFPILRYTRGVAPDGSGGFYVAGGLSISGVVHLRADGSRDPRFAVTVSGRSVALAVEGETLYVIGEFDKVNGARRHDFAAVDRRTGRVLSWHPSTSVAPTGGVLVLVRGTVIVSRGSGLAALDTRTGRLRWTLDADLAGDGSVPALNGGVNTALVAGGRLFAAGAFDRVRVAGRWTAAGPRAVPIELDPRTGRVLWRARRSVGDEIYSLEAVGRTLYVGGKDSGFRVDLRTGRVLGRVIGDAGSFARAGHVLYLGGGLQFPLRIPGRNNLAAIDLRSGRVRPFAPKLTRYQDVGPMIVSGDHVLVRGAFLKSIG